MLSVYTFPTVNHHTLQCLLLTRREHTAHKCTCFFPSEAKHDHGHTYKSRLGTPPSTKYDGRFSCWLANILNQKACIKWSSLYI